VKVLYIRNLSSDVTEDSLKEKFTEFGKIDRVKKIKDYGFVHYEERDDAVKALDAMNGQV
jgi:RNA recognition motif-containing protein